MEPDDNVRGVFGTAVFRLNCLATDVLLRYNRQNDRVGRNRLHLGSFDGRTLCDGSSWGENMNVQSRKQRELREREELFLDVARRLLLERGFHGLTMDRIAEETEYSKGTIYLHFGCKEELIVELGKRSRKQRLELIERGAAFRGRPRERVFATGVAVEIHARLFPDDVRIWEIMNAESIIEKIPANRQPDLKASDIAVIEILVQLVQEAVACGDLHLRPDDSPQEILSLIHI